MTVVSHNLLPEILHDNSHFSALMLALTLTIPYQIRLKASDMIENNSHGRNCNIRSSDYPFLQF